MTIDDLDAFRRAFAPDEAAPPWIGDPNTPLTFLLPPSASSRLLGTAAMSR